MNRALDALTVAAFLTLLVGVTDAGRPVPAIVAGLVYAALAIAGFGWVRRRAARRAALGYVAVQLVLGYVVFVLSGATVGAVLLMLVLVSQTVLLLSLRYAVVVVAVLPLAHLGMPWRAGLREGLGMLIAAVFAAVLTHFFLREQDARVRLREYALQAERLAAAQERNRVARDIHDGLGHSLTVVQMQVKAARAVLATNPEQADAVLQKAEHQAEHALAEVRRSVAAMREPRPPVPLAEALRALADDASAAGVPTSLGVAGAARELTADAEESLYRAAQEGLTNVRKHANASRAELRLDFTRPSAVRLEVQDDGDGAGPDRAPTAGYGLLGVRERAAHAGGWMSLESAPGRGSTLSVEVPG